MREALHIMTAHDLDSAPVHTFDVRDARSALRAAKRLSRRGTVCLFLTVDGEHPFEGTFLACYRDGRRDRAQRRSPWS